MASRRVVLVPAVAGLVGAALLAGAAPVLGLDPTPSPTVTGLALPTPSPTPVDATPGPSPLARPGVTIVPAPRPTGLLHRSAAVSSTVDPSLMQLASGSLTLGASDTLAYAGPKTVQGTAVLEFTLTGTGTFHGLDIASPCRLSARLDTTVTSPATASMAGATWDVTQIAFSIGTTAYSFNVAAPPTGAPFPVSGTTLTAFSWAGVQLSASSLAMHGAAENFVAC